MLTQPRRDQGILLQTGHKESVVIIDLTCIKISLFGKKGLLWGKKEIEHFYLLLTEAVPVALGD
jgi:hypothetical protein